MYVNTDRNLHSEYYVALIGPCGSPLAECFVPTDDYEVAEQVAYDMADNLHRQGRLDVIPKIVIEEG